jgi:hypothetical protein
MFTAPVLLILVRVYYTQATGVRDHILFSFVCTLVYRQHRYPTKSNLLNFFQKLGIIATVILIAACVAYSR